jgi:hypothetical protein
MKRIFLALTLLPALSAPALAEDGKTGAKVSGVQLQRGVGTPCEQGMEFRFAFIKEGKTFAVCDGENWRKLVIGDVIPTKGTDTEEGAKK